LDTIVDVVILLDNATWKTRVNFDGAHQPYSCKNTSNHDFLGKKFNMHLVQVKIDFYFEKIACGFVHKR